MPPRGCCVVILRRVGDCSRVFKIYIYFFTRNIIYIHAYTPSLPPSPGYAPFSFLFSTARTHSSVLGGTYLRREERVKRRRKVQFKAFLHKFVSFATLCCFSLPLPPPTPSEKELVTLRASFFHTFYRFFSFSFSPDQIWCYLQTISMKSMIFLSFNKRSRAWSPTCRKFEIAALE